jgi:hypothetical protein
MRSHRGNRWTPVNAPSCFHCLTRGGPDYCPARLVCVSNAGLRILVCRSMSASAQTSGGHRLRKPPLTGPPPRPSGFAPSDPTTRRSGGSDATSSQSPHSQIDDRGDAVVDASRLLPVTPPGGLPAGVTGPVVTGLGRRSRCRAAVGATQNGRVNGREQSSSTPPHEFTGCGGVLCPSQPQQGRDSAAPAASPHSVVPVSAAAASPTASRCADRSPATRFWSCSAWSRMTPAALTAARSASMPSRTSPAARMRSRSSRTRPWYTKSSSARCSATAARAAAC